jgi:hypothetical protein
VIQGDKVVISIADRRHSSPDRSFEMLLSENKIQKEWTWDPHHYHGQSYTEDATEWICYKSHMLTKTVGQMNKYGSIRLNFLHLNFGHFQ